MKRAKISPPIMDTLVKDWEKIHAPKGVSRIAYANDTIYLVGRSVWQLNRKNLTWDQVGNLNGSIMAFSVFGDEICVGCDRKLFRYHPSLGWIDHGPLAFHGDSSPRQILSVASGPQGIFVGTKFYLHFLSRKIIDFIDSECQVKYKKSGKKVVPLVPFTKKSEMARGSGRIEKGHPRSKILENSGLWDNKCLDDLGGGYCPDEMICEGEGVWIGDAEGLAYWPSTSRGSLLRYPFPPSRNTPLRLSCSLGVSSGAVWIGMGGGVCRLDRSANTWNVHRFDQYPISIMTLSDDEIMVVLEGEGLFHLDNDGQLRRIPVPVEENQEIRRATISQDGIEIIVREKPRLDVDGLSPCEAMRRIIIAAENAFHLSTWIVRGRF